MKILVTGATGFIASQIVTDLIAANHDVTCCVRNISYAKNLFPTATLLPCDFINDTTTDYWTERLKNIDIVINCVGIFSHPNIKAIWAIHYYTPCALFKACVEVGVKKIIQISALGVDTANVDYAKSKKAADDFLLTLPITSIILRPSLVYGHGSYGGTSLFRGLAALPWFIPIPGKGEQEFQPIYLHDLSKAIIHLISVPLNQSILLNAVSSKHVKLYEILTITRAWLGLTRAKLLYIPLMLIRLIAFLGNLKPYSVLNTTSLKMLMQNNVATLETTKVFHDQISFIPRDFTEGIYSEPSTVQDRWHAKLYFLRPLLQVAIAFLWLFTGICSLFLYPKSASYNLLAQVGVIAFWQPILFYGASILDLLLGLGMLFSFQLKKICTLQIFLILIYSAIITWKLPNLWLEPFGPIVKNIPLLIAILVLIALEDER